jgi:hypothetical protein
VLAIRQDPCTGLLRQKVPSFIKQKMELIWTLLPPFLSTEPGNYGEPAAWRFRFQAQKIFGSSVNPSQIRGLQNSAGTLFSK